MYCITTAKVQAAAAAWTAWCSRHSVTSAALTPLKSKRKLLMDSGDGSSSSTSTANSSSSSSSSGGVLKRARNDDSLQPIAEESS
jgi:hypothetical protein